jgi:alcohol dehydrogenase
MAVLGIGGLGHLAVQYSKAAGFSTIAITHSKDKEELASKLGADLIVSNGEALKQAGGADVILVTSNSYKADYVLMEEWSLWVFQMNHL